MAGFKGLARRLIEVVYPSRCGFCGVVTQESRGVCTECEKKLPILTHEICKNCGRELEYCTCRKRRYEFNRVIAPFYYEGVAKKGILRLKFGEKPYAAQVFAGYASDFAKREYRGIAFDLVTAVPLSASEMRKRGFNQSAEFAKGLSKGLGIPFVEALSKPFDTKPQRKCSVNERWGNVFGAFEAKGSMEGKTILLADDIATTGATLNECAKVLRFAGAREVYCVVVACVKKT